MRYSPCSTAVAIFFFALAGGLFAAESKEGANLLAKPSRESLQNLKTAEEAIAKESYGEAVVELRKILDPSSDDGFLPLDDRNGSCRTIKSEAIRLLDGFPPDARKIYELQCKTEVERRLNEVVGVGDRAELAAIAQNYCPSEIGAEVALLLVRDALDRGHPEESLAWLRYLERAPNVSKRHEIEIALLETVSYLKQDDPRKSLESLGKLNAMRPPAAFRLGAEEHTTAERPERLLASFGETAKNVPNTAPRSISGWPMFRGDMARNASAAWTGPLGERRWRLGVLDGAEMQQFRSWRRTDADEVLFCSLQPLIVGDLLLARSPRRLSAFDLRNGRLLWEYPPQNKSKEDANKAADEDTDLWQRFWNDAPYGQMSSNGSEVFLIEGLGSALSGNAVPRVVAAGNKLKVIVPKPAQPFNRLMALSLRQQGKVSWAIGGEEGENEPLLAGYFFLGPPLPHNRHLYALAEKDGMIRLCSLNSASGKLEWSLPLVQVDAEIVADPVRRLAGASPSMCDGVLVCPTSAGAAVAVDPLTRSLLWGFEYPVADLLAERGAPIVIVQNGMVKPASLTKVNCTVRDASPVMAAGRTLLLPVESDRLFCFDTVRGELLWSCPREEMLFIAGVTADKVILAGKRGLGAKNLQNGKPAWREEFVELPGKSQLIGRGFLAGGYCYLPSTWNEIVKFDLQSGRIAERFPTKNSLGNLTAAQNLLISHTGDALQVFGSGKEGTSALVPTKETPNGK